MATQFAGDRCERRRVRMVCQEIVLTLGGYHRHPIFFLIISIHLLHSLQKRVYVIFIFYVDEQLDLMILYVSFHFILWINSSDFSRTQFFNSILRAVVFWFNEEHVVSSWRRKNSYCHFQFRQFLFFQLSLKVLLIFANNLWFNDETNHLRRNRSLTILILPKFIQIRF